MLGSFGYFGGLFLAESEWKTLSIEFSAVTSNGILLIMRV